MSLRLWTSGAVLAAVAACGVVAAMPDATEGARLYADYCAGCHGSDATGGPAPDGRRAPDLTRIAQRAGGTLPRAPVLSQIDGYGRRSVEEGGMPEFGAELGGDLVPLEVDGVMTPTPRALAALVVWLESVQR